jgi:actin-like ATPase involved in cell morphogenesis
LAEALGPGEDAEARAVGAGQPVDGQAAGDVVSDGQGARDVRVIGTPGGSETQAQPGPDQVGERHPVAQRHG